MKKVVVLLLLFTVFVADKSFAQYGRRYYPRYRRYPERNADPYFKPSVYLSIGYGFPNLDKNELLHFYNFYRGNTNQTGPIHASIDYQFNRSTSVGVMVAYAKVSAPYFDYNNSSTTALHSMAKWKTGVFYSIWYDTYPLAELYLLIYEQRSVLAYGMNLIAIRAALKW